jgi:hypothetical protein
MATWLRRPRSLALQLTAPPVVQTTGSVSTMVFVITLYMICMSGTVVQTGPGIHQVVLQIYALTVLVPDITVLDIY